MNGTADNPVDVIVLTDVPAPLPIDRTMPAAALDPTPADDMLTAGGIAYLSGTHAARSYPDLWRTASAVKAAIARAEKWDAFSNVLNKPGSASHLQRVLYKVAGQGHQAAEAIVDLSRVTDPRQTITETLGELAEFRVIDDAEVAQRRREERKRPIAVPKLPPERPFWNDPITIPDVPAWVPEPWELPPWVFPPSARTMGPPH